MRLVSALRDRSLRGVARSCARLAAPARRRRADRGGHRARALPL